MWNEYEHSKNVACLQHLWKAPYLSFLGTTEYGYSYPSTHRI